MTCLGVTHSNTHRIKHLHINSCPCWPCQGASRQMPPDSAMEDAAFSPTLLHLNRRLLKFCFQLTEMDARITLFTQWEEETLKAHLHLFSPIYRRCCHAGALLNHPLHPQTDSELFHPLQVCSCHLSLCTWGPSSHSPAQTSSWNFLCQPQFMRSNVWKEFCDILWRAQHKNKLYRVK